MSDAERIAELAKKATPGPYRVVYETPEYMLPYWAICAPDHQRSRVYSNENDADYFAALDPATVLNLIQHRDTARREREEAMLAVKLLRGALESLRQVTIPPQDISGRRMYDGAVEALAATASIPIEQEPPA